MSGGHRVSRRRLAQLLAVALPSVPRFVRAQTIGGTGVVGDPKDESDQMIGGTGVIGTIRRFGSIYVNDLRITYPDDLPVMQHGARVGTADLKLGQVVRVTTAMTKGNLVARSISVVHEVVGPIEAVATDRITVLGQTVSLEADPEAPPLTPGQQVAVSGLRHLDGTIVASLIETAPGIKSRVAGPLIRSATGSLTVGELRVLKVDPALAGRRVYLAGQKRGAALVVTEAVGERAILAKLGPKQWSLEAYVSRDVVGLHFGSGLQVDGVTISPRDEELAVVTIGFADGKRLVALKVQVEANAATRRTREKEDKGERNGFKGGSGHGSGGHAGGGHGHR